MKTKRVVLCAALLSALGLQAVARADTVVPNCSSDAACLSLYERAKTASNQGDLDEALRLYKLAHEVKSDPLLLLSIGRILHKQGKPEEARPYYVRFLAAPTEDPVPRQKAEEYLQQLGKPTRSAATKAERATSANSSIGPSTSPAENPSVNPSTNPSTEPVPLYKRWWLWTLIGVGVAGGVAAGVAIGVTSAQSQNPIPEGTPTIKWTF